GYEGYDYFTPQSSTQTPPGASFNYGGGGAPSGTSWEPPKGPELGLGPSDSFQGNSIGNSMGNSIGNPSENPDSIIAKINQRLDLLAKEGAGAGQGVEEQESSFRFDSFSSYDPRPSLGSSRDPFRAGFPFGDSASERENPFGSRNSRGSFGILRNNLGNGN
ncbi:AKAP8 protein, partial [Orthonyx spaldingii]|nr:AKAP8 protein [Orthonyx spaldingii]